MWLTLSALMIVLESGSAVPAKTAGGCVGVEVGGGAKVGGASVGAGGSGAAQAVNNSNKVIRKMNRRFFIFHSFSCSNLKIGYIKIHL